MIRVNRSTFLVKMKLTMPISTWGITPVMATKTAATLNQKSDFKLYLAYSRKKIEAHASTSRITKMSHLLSTRTFKVPQPHLFRIFPLHFVAQKVLNYMVILGLSLTVKSVRSSAVSVTITGNFFANKLPANM